MEHPGFDLQQGRAQPTGRSRYMSQHQVAQEEFASNSILTNTVDVDWFFFFFFLILSDLQWGEYSLPQDM